MIVTNEDFEYKYPDWYTDPDISEEERQERTLIAGEPEMWSWVNEEQLDDSCFACGEPIKGTPFVFWRGATKNTCLHVQCSIHLGAGLIRDGLENLQGVRFAAKWHGDAKELFYSITDTPQTAWPQIGNHYKEFGSCLYKGVRVLWDEDRDERIFDVIDQMSDYDRAKLRFAHESKAMLWLLWNKNCPIPDAYQTDQDIFPGDGDVFSIAQSENFPD